MGLCMPHTIRFGHALRVDTDERVPGSPEQHCSPQFPPHEEYNTTGTHVEGEWWHKVTPVFIKLSLVGQVT